MSIVTQYKILNIILKPWDIVLNLTIFYATEAFINNDITL